MLSAMNINPTVQANMLPYLPTAHAPNRTIDTDLLLLVVDNPPNQVDLGLNQANVIWKNCQKIGYELK